MTYLSDQGQNSDKCPPVESAQHVVLEDSRHKKIVEFNSANSRISKNIGKIKKTEIAKSGTD